MTHTDICIPKTRSMRTTLCVSAHWRVRGGGHGGLRYTRAATPSVASTYCDRLRDSRAPCAFSPAFSRQADPIWATTSALCASTYRSRPATTPSTSSPAITRSPPSRTRRSCASTRWAWLWTSWRSASTPTQSALFAQQDVPEVTELAWILSCVTPMGLLERAVSYKDKIAQGLAPNHGLFAYPVLQAADILIYLSDLVPVGQDQKQHLEMTRDIAGKFNQQFGEVFVLPEPYILDSTAVVPGIDGRKMSKSYGNEIGIFDEGKELKKKIMSIVTDSAPVEAPKDPAQSTPSSS